MPNIKSQAKRVEVSAIENARNSAKKTKVKNAIKNSMPQSRQKTLQPQKSHTAPQSAKSTAQESTAFIISTPLPERKRRLLALLTL